METESEEEWNEWPEKAKEAMNKPAKKAAYIYTRVIGNRYGKKKMTAEEQLNMIAWINEHISRTGQE